MVVELPGRLRAALLPLDGTVAAVSGYRQAAVLVVLFPRPSGPYFLLTERPPTLTRHAGQISLPGGAAEPGDRTLWQTALRETREELGIRTDELEPLGRLQSITVAASGYLVAPFVAWSPVEPAVQPDPAEVAAIIEVPLAELLDPEAVEEETWELRGGQWRVTFYRLRDAVVWGATARILADLATRLGAPPLAPAPGSVRRT